MNKGFQIEVFEILLWELLRVKTFFWEEVGDQNLGKTFVAAMGEALNVLKLMSRLQVAVMDHMKKNRTSCHRPSHKLCFAFLKTGGGHPWVRSSRL